MKQQLGKTAYTKDIENKQIVVEREFAAPLERVWRAWTEAEFLDQWWAPKPWKAETKSMDFRVGGSWLYSMVGPEGERHWSRLDYQSITRPHAYEAEDCFCDENGKPNESFPGTHWSVKFAEAGSATRVTVTITYPSVEALEMHVEMGFEQGFAAGHENLDAVLASVKF